MIRREISANFVVVGGGMAGVCAAIAAARNGATVILVQDRSVLGGNASSEVRMHIVGADCHGTRPGARETGLIEELRLRDAAWNPHRSFSQWDLLLYEKVMSEPNITLLLDTDCVGCEMDLTSPLRRITSVRAVRQSTEEEFIIRAAYFADCSGDGRLGVEAGADFTVGREDRAAFGESLALEVGDCQTLGCSILFTAKPHATPQPFSAPAWVRRFQRHEFKHRPIRSYEYGFWWSEWGGQLNTIHDSPVIRHELLRIALGIWDYIKNSGEHPDSLHWAIDWIGAIPGKRESRRFLGQHILTQHDVEQGRVYSDQVAYGGWWLDLHPPSGVDAPDEPPCAQHHFPNLFSIPFRALCSRNVGNLLFAGRNISATHVAFASTRVMGTCAVVGQAVGTAAALASRGCAQTLEASFAGEGLVNLQQTLLKDDAFLPGLRNGDSADLARQAVVEASSETPGSAADQIRDGVTRELPTHLGPWADGGSHRWESTGLPAWIELSWREPRSITEIHLTFDSGLQRELILTPSERVSSQTIRGPQPELVCDYHILLDGAVVLTESGNVQRKRVHRLTHPVAARKLRLLVKSAHGISCARVFEIRAY